jgi:hypothetical protein
VPFTIEDRTPPPTAVDIGPEDPMSFEENEDGSVTIDVGDEPGEGDIPEHTFDANLAEVIPDDEITTIGSDLLHRYDMARAARQDWWETYKKGVKLLGFKVEEKSDPWPGAAGMHHPVLAEAAVRFQANAISEMFPAGGPVKTKIVGKATDEKVAQASRVKQDMNWVMLEEMPSYRDEQERMLLNLCLAGSAFKKVYYRNSTAICSSEFISADDLIVNYGASTLEDADLVIHRYRESENAIKKRIENGEFREVDVSPAMDEETDTEEAEAEAIGEARTVEDDPRHILLEAHVELAISVDQDEESNPFGIKRPYIVTLDSQTQQVFSIYRNWREDDGKYKPNQFFSHYKYLPGFGFYGLGLIHLIAGLTEAATLTLRALVDSGSLNNMPSGFKAKTARTKGDNSPLRPGQFRDMDIGGGTIRDSLFVVPFNEPSQVLYQLLRDVVEEARNLAVQEGSRDDRERDPGPLPARVSVRDERPAGHTRD